MNVVCTHSAGHPCPYCGATQPHGAPCAVLERNGLYQLLFVGGARRTIGPERWLADQTAARYGVTIRWDQPKPVADGRTSYPLEPLS